MLSEIAFLAYYPTRKRFNNNSFEGNYNIGANIIMDVLRRKGIYCDICTPDTAQKYKIVLISLTSDYDCIAFYCAVALLPSWQPGRRFKVVAGGAGMQNPTTIKKYIDYAVFGRGENIIYPLIDCIKGGGMFTHESIMNLPDIHSVKLCQASELYPHEINLGRGCRQWSESFIGCPNKCLFCNYTWTRKRVGNGDTYYQCDLTMKRSIECLWKDIPKINKKEGRIRTAIDGFSERLRMIYGKKISNREIIDGINHLGGFPGITVLLVYNISNMPHETQDDREELYLTMRQPTPKNRIIVVLHSTPFRPSLLTPMQWAPVTLYPATSDSSAQVIHDSDKLRVIHSFSNEGPWAQLETMIVNRATTETDKLFHALCFHVKLKKGTSREKVELLKRSFDLTPYLRDYSAEEIHPAWFLSSYSDNTKLRGLYNVAESKISGKESQL
ncbi:MAG: hypothetical protein UY48_C0010G0030 [Candidatus Gottesmanbacteria bacterium GW2011_GWB1_49_7]|uniref:Radical SAM domain protein n=1 Tax=Candidatus Gottesmanbacteria bacterium GW2011_GWB1_49_7 TaxID=1618448 RepID=A0A0G1W1U9_9BACT|nr:MAG: hypothetical protein UY48_C0010G0030 [Candidatus Gottesmanbacteria bacterium GW2011_GWB1_49_7]